MKKLKFLICLFAISGLLISGSCHTQNQGSSEISMQESQASSESSSKISDESSVIPKSQESSEISFEVSAESSVIQKSQESSEISSEISADSSVIQESQESSKISFESSAIQESQESSEISVSSLTEPSIESSRQEPKKVSCPEEWQDNGIFSAYYEEAYGLLSEMSLEEKVGQILLARCPASDYVTTARNYHLGGYVLFGVNFENKTKNQIIAELNSTKYSQEIPMILSVDEEGGTVARVSRNPEIRSEVFSSPRELYEQGGLDFINQDAKEKADLLSSLCINTNLAPVCDLSNQPSDFMYDRSLGLSPEATGEYIASVTKISQQNNVSVCLKHFPGYGNNVDTHTGIAVDKRTLESFRKNDFIPFQYGINAGAHSVLVSHNIVECMDSEKPASISPNVHEILRNELKFTGIIITDDMIMEGITQYSGEYSPVVSAVLAGNDMILVSEIDNAYHQILSAVQNKVIDEEMIDHAVMRVLSWKYTKGLL